MKKIITAFTVIFLLEFSVAQAQETCKVSMETIVGTYTGACKSGKASGAGKSVGTDTYEGNFKNGYPDGEGTYTFSNGNYYVGAFKKGNRDGEGKMYYKTSAGTDSLVVGFWKKDKYVGLHEKPYKIHDVTSNVGRVEVLKFANGNSIAIELKSLGGQGLNASYDARLTEIRRISGNFNSKSTNRLSNTEVTTLRDVTFPFRAKFLVGASTIEVEIYEKADWRIIIPILK